MMPVHSKSSRPGQFLIILVVLILGIALYKLNQTPKKIQTSLITAPIPQTSETPTIPETPTPKIYHPIENYSPPQVKQAPSYTILFVGDSMTAALGENFDELRKDLANYYPNKVFGLFNYGFGSTNIFSVDDRLHNDTHYLGKTMPPILGRYFDVIIIESFGYNPLSQYNRELGLIHQTETTNKILAEIVEAKPESLIILMSTIAPSKQYFGQGTTDLSPHERQLEAEERIAYLENQISYAKKHNYPLIDVYHKSLDKNGNAILRYINPNDHIHPSIEGVKLISQTIADFLSQNNILPK